MKDIDAINFLKCLSPLTIMARVKQMFSKVTAEHSLFQDTSLFQLLLGGTRLHEGAQKCDQLAMLLRHYRKLTILKSFKIHVASL